MLDCVLPIIRKDVRRFHNLRLTLDKFMRFEGTIYMVVPPKDVDLFEDVVKDDDRFWVLNEIDLVPELGLHRFKNVSGWRRQQVIKLAVLPHIKSEWYLTLDADVLLVRDVTEDSLIRDDQGLVNLMGREYFPEWYEGSLKILGLEKRPPEAVMVTPFLFNRVVMGDLHHRLRFEALKHKSIFEFLMAKQGWTEYSLYHTSAWNAGVWDAYHTKAGFPLFGNCIWHHKDAEKWDAAKSFEGGQKFFFTVIQSNTKLSAEWVRERISKYL